MNPIKQLLSAVLIATASASAMADLDLYVDDHSIPNAIKARVYMDGKPVEGATVVLSASGGVFKKEMTTDKHGRALFTKHINYGPVTLQAHTAEEKSRSHSLFLHAKER